MKRTTLPETSAANGTSTNTEAEKCEDCVDGIVSRREGFFPCRTCHGTGKSPTAPQEEPPTGTIFELDLFREKLERRADSVEGSTTTNVSKPYGEVQTGDRLAKELRDIAAELKTLIDNCQKQYVHAEPNPSPPTPSPEGPYRRGDEINIPTPTGGGRILSLQSDVDIANAAWIEGHKAGQTIPDGVVEAAKALVADQYGLSPAERTPNVELWNNLAAALDNTPKETDNRG